MRGRSDSRRSAHPRMSGASMHWSTNAPDAPPASARSTSSDVFSAAAGVGGCSPSVALVADAGGEARRSGRVTAVPFAP